MSMTEYERLQELLYRLREIMPEIGENPVADEMYNMVFEYAENTDENVVEVVRAKTVSITDSLTAKTDTRTASSRAAFGACWGAETALCRNSFATTAKEEKVRMKNDKR